MAALSLRRRRPRRPGRWLLAAVAALVVALIVMELHLGRTVLLSSATAATQPPGAGSGGESLRNATTPGGAPRPADGLEALELERLYNFSHLSLHERMKIRRAMQNRDRVPTRLSPGREPTQERRTQSPSGGAFIHMGKTGGSAISLLLRNGCHSFMPHPCRRVPNETVASRRIESYYHVPDFAFLRKSHHDFYLISTRDPFDRLVSAFVYQHVWNIDARGDIDIPDKREKYAAASRCFDSLESFIRFLDGNHSDYDYPYRPNDVVPEPCQDFARAVFHGRVRIFTHLYFSYGRVASFVPELERQVVYATRQTNLWEDWVRINRLIGQATPVHVPSDQTSQARNTSLLTDRALPVTRDLSSRAVDILCKALGSEYDAYFLWLRLARNLDQADYQQEVDRVQRRCPMVTAKPHSVKTL